MNDSKLIYRWRWDADANQFLVRVFLHEGIARHFCGQLRFRPDQWERIQHGLAAVEVEEDGPLGR